MFQQSLQKSEFILTIQLAKSAGGPSQLRPTQPKAAFISMRSFQHSFLRQSLHSCAGPSDTLVCQEIWCRRLILLRRLLILWQSQTKALLDQKFLQVFFLREGLFSSPFLKKNSSSSNDFPSMMWPTQPAMSRNYWAYMSQISAGTRLQAGAKCTRTGNPQNWMSLLANHRSLVWLRAMPLMCSTKPSMHWELALKAGLLRNCSDSIVWVIWSSVNSSIYL